MQLIDGREGNGAFSIGERQRERERRLKGNERDADERLPSLVFIEFGYIYTDCSQRPTMRLHGVYTDCSFT